MTKLNCQCGYLVEAFEYFRDNSYAYAKSGICPRCPNVTYFRGNLPFCSSFYKRKPQPYSWKIWNPQQDCRHSPFIVNHQNIHPVRDNINWIFSLLSKHPNEYLISNASCKVCQRDNIPVIADIQGKKWKIRS